MLWQKQIQLLTPTFCRGAYQDTPELRVPSIRGMVRWWFRALGGSADDEKLAFGGLNNFGQELRGRVIASSLVFRVSHALRAANPKPPALPHKQGGMGNPQAAFALGQSFQLQVTSRLLPIPEALEKRVRRALEVWTLVGSLGLRANRGGGSLWPQSADAPGTPTDLRKRLDELGFKWPVYLAPSEAGSTAEELRAAATDTVSEPAWLFGKAGGGRQASVLKMKVVRLEDKLRLLITSPEQKNIEVARSALRGHRCRPERWEKI